MKVSIRLRWFRGAILVFVALVLSLGCGGEERAAPAPKPPTAAPAPAPPPADRSAQAASFFASRCVTCHGEKGAGDGPGSHNLSPPPRDFQDPAWQGEVSDDHIAKIVQYGGSAVGRSPTMPGNPDLASKPELVAALVAHIRGLAAQ